MSMTSYSVHVAEYLGMPRNHHAIFIQTGTDRSGHVFQVTGSIKEGMTFAHRAVKPLEESASFLGKEYVGTILATDFDRVEAIVNTVQPPEKQFNGPKRIDPSKPLRRCQEWTAEALRALKAAEILRTE